jgi:uncharacterized protein YndB with AHSA1/START domain
MKLNPTTVTTPTDRQVVITRRFAAPRGLVWDAWTNPKHLPQWLFGPHGWKMSACEIDLRPGGTWHFRWRRVTTEDDDGQEGGAMGPTVGTEMSIRGTYREIVPSRRLVSTDFWGGNWPDTLSTVTPTDEDGGSATTITQQISYPTHEARDAALATGLPHRMCRAYDRLDDYLQTIGDERVETSATVLASNLT